MKNKEFFYRQYDKINWEKQEKTRINVNINDFILKEIISQNKNKTLKLFDIGFGIGIFFEQLQKLSNKYSICAEGCEPSEKNYDYFSKHFKLKNKKLKLKTYRKTFFETNTKTKYDFILSVYSFPHILIDDLDKTVKQIRAMLLPKGKFILAVANEKYIKTKLKSKKDLFIEESKVKYKGKEYNEVLHYTDIPEIGKVIDYNRDESLYLDLFSNNKFKLKYRKDFNDHDFICTIFVFEKL
jgi:2-polyprenyl-3-methyl-5-hydroxy-6-metoxy-1,4-benzoquinol methylase